MKRFWMLLPIILLLLGCTGQEDMLEPMLQLRTELLQKGCSFDAEIAADFGDRTYEFTLACTADEQGNISFSVRAPQTIAGITGSVSAGEGALTFDDSVLIFELVADGELSPVSAPWVLMKAMRGGYIRSCGKDGVLTQVSLDDSYQEDALQLELWLDENNLPTQAEIFCEGRRILTLCIKDFVFS